MFVLLANAGPQLTRVPSMLPRTNATSSRNNAIGITNSPVPPTSAAEGEIVAFDVTGRRVRDLSQAHVVGFKPPRVFEPFKSSTSTSPLPTSSLSSLLREDNVVGIRPPSTFDYVPKARERSSLPKTIHSRRTRDPLPLSPTKEPQHAPGLSSPSATMEEESYCVCEPPLLPTVNESRHVHNPPSVVAASESRPVHEPSALLTSGDVQNAREPLPSPTNSESQLSDNSYETIGASDSDVGNDGIETVHKPSVATIDLAVRQQQGWHSQGRRSTHTNMKTHPVIEDAYYVPLLPNDKVHAPTNTRYTVLALADGHGGWRAARYFCDLMPRYVQDVMDSKDHWDFRDPEDQTIFRRKMRKAYKDIDNTFLVTQKRKFLDWQQNGRPDPCPNDEGSTLVVVVLYDGVAIVANLGDSKTIFCKSVQKWTNRKRTVALEFTYQSTDHSPGHPEKAYHIQSNGGVFRRVEDEKLIKAKITQPPSDASQPPSPSSASRFAPYPSLLKARVCRPEGYQNSYGLPEDVSINLGDALGDLYFKLDPPLFQCEPDVDFIELEEGTEYLGILAPDGLWDHLRLKIPDMVRTIAKYLTEVESWHEIEDLETCLHREGLSRLPRTNVLSSETLERLAWALCDRKSDELRIFERDQGRYDDCTIIVLAVMFGEGGGR